MSVVLATHTCHFAWKKSANGKVFVDTTCCRATDGGIHSITGREGIRDGGEEEISVQREISGRGPSVMLGNFELEED
jgi:hypothetical protein